MIGHLHGILQQIGESSVILDVNGVGYEVNLSKTTLNQLPQIGQSLSLTINTIVREDAIALYGFANQKEKLIFNLLLSVSGIGPKQANNILSNATTEQLIQAILSMDVDFLESIRGIGRKTAEKIILDTKDRLAKIQRQEGLAESPFPAATNNLRNDLVAALLQLGYRRHEIGAALERIPLAEKTNLQQAIKESLRILATQSATGV